MSTDLPAWTKTLNDICVHVKAQQWVISAKGDFNDQVERMTCLYRY